MEQKQYLVQTLFGDGIVSAGIKTANEIINCIDMKDCNNAEFCIFKIEKFGEAEPLTIHGCWHDQKNPLYIKVVDKNGDIEFDGYGTDH